MISPINDDAEVASVFRASSSLLGSIRSRTGGVSDDGNDGNDRNDGNSISSSSSDDDNDDDSSGFDGYLSDSIVHLEECSNPGTQNGIRRLESLESGCVTDDDIISLASQNAFLNRLNAEADDERLLRISVGGDDNSSDDDEDERDEDERDDDDSIADSDR